MAIKENPTRNRSLVIWYIEIVHRNLRKTDHRAEGKAKILKFWSLSTEPFPSWIIDLVE